jgi:hypothetical protein
MADIQAEGLRAAGELLERVLGTEPERPEPPPDRPAAEHMPLIDAWLDLIRRTIAGVTQPAPPGSVTVPIGSSGVGPSVRLELRRPQSANGATAPAAAATAEVWLHNGTGSPVGPLTLRCAELADSNGTVLEGAEVRFEPREIAELPARSSRGVVVSLPAGESLRPGIYRSTIQAAGEPSLWLPLEVVIEEC